MILFELYISLFIFLQSSIYSWTWSVDSFINSWLIMLSERNLLIPNLINIVSYWRRAISSWSINWKFWVKSLSSLTERIFVRHCQIKSWSFPGSSVWLPIIQTQSTFYLFRSFQFRSNIVYLIFQIIFSADSARVGILGKTITLHRWMKIWRARSWILLHSLIISQVWTLKSIISFK